MRCSPASASWRRVLAALCAWREDPAGRHRRRPARPQARDQGTPVEGGAVILRRLDDAAYPEPELAADEAWWHDVVTSTDNSDVEWMAAEDPLFILYTSGSAFAASFPFCLIYPRLLDLPFHPRSLRRAAV